MTDDIPIRLKGTVGLIGIVHAPPELTPFGGFPNFAANPDYVKLRFRLDDIEQSRTEVDLKKDDVKRMNLMVGDNITLHISSKNFPRDTSAPQAAYSTAMIGSVQLNGLVAGINRKRERKGTTAHISQSWSPDVGSKINLMPTIEPEAQPIDPKYLEYLDLNLTFPDAKGYGGISLKKNEILRMQVTAGDSIFIMVTKP